MELIFFVVIVGIKERSLFFRCTVSFVLPGFTLVTLNDDVIAKVRCSVPRLAITQATKSRAQEGKYATPFKIHSVQVTAWNLLSSLAIIPVRVQLGKCGNLCRMASHNKKVSRAVGDFLKSEFPDLGQHLR